VKVCHSNLFFKEKNWRLSFHLGEREVTIRSAVLDSRNSADSENATDERGRAISRLRRAESSSIHRMAVLSGFSGSSSSIRAERRQRRRDRHGGASLAAVQRRAAILIGAALRSCFASP
jgi:hypothetical protein